MASAVEEIAERRDELRVELDNHRSAVVQLERELEALTVALKVLNRAYETVAPRTAPAERAAPVQRKPDALPSMPVLIVRAIQDASAEGHAALRPKEIVEYIAQNHWPDVKLASVGPIVARMRAAGKLVKVQPKFGKAALYALPQDETPAERPAGVSEPDPSSEGLFD